jgi:hypothetical protein
MWLLDANMPVQLVALLNELGIEARFLQRRVVGTHLATDAW